MIQAASRRIRKMGAPLMFAVVALGATPQAARAVDEFATRPAPKSQVPVKTQATLGTRVTEVYVLRAPDVVGQPVGSARTTLERSRLRAGRETTQQTSERAPGTVIGQDPKPGTPVQPGAVVNLVIATPPRVVAVPAPSQNLPIERIPGGVRVPPATEVLVPNLIGQPAEVASAILAKPGLNLGDRRRQDSDAPAGTVIAQSPAAGTRVRPGASVDVTVAVSSLVTVPDLTGETPQQAARMLRRYQLGLGQQRERESQAPAGTVIRQAPAAGTQVARDTLVNVLIAAAPTPVPPPARAQQPPVVVAPPVVIKPPVVIAPPAIVFPPIVIAPPAPPAPPVVIAPPVPPAPPIVATPPMPPAPPVAPEPQLPPPPAPPVATAPPAPAAPIVAPPPTVATALPAPAPVRKPASKPQPSPAARPAPIPPAPPVATAPPAPPVVAQAPALQPAAQPVRESPKRQWPGPIAWGLGSVALLGAAGTVYYRARTTSGTPPVATLPTVTFAAHWDLGTQQIESDALLSSGAGLRLQSGVEAVTTTLETDDLVADTHETGGSR